MQIVVSARNSEWSVTARKSSGRASFIERVGFPLASYGGKPIVSPFAKRYASSGRLRTSNEAASNE